MHENNKAIVINKLYRNYKIPVREYGFKNKIRSLYKRQYEIVHAVKDISFTVENGEIIGLIGLNGAGKTTTIKMLTGLIYPSSGEIRVGGFIPYLKEKEFLKKISLLMGNRNRLIWDLPVVDSFDLYGCMYHIKKDEYLNAFKELVEKFDIYSLLDKPVRNLSLGQRMKCEVALSLIHNPEYLFFDEPTIGLDIITQHIIRDFITNYNNKHGATFLVTSHNMGDIENLCSRIIIINKGEIIFNGSLKELKKISIRDKVIDIEILDKSVDVTKFGKVVKKTFENIKILVKKDEVGKVIEELLKNKNVTNAIIEEPSIETIIEEIFKREIM